MDNVLCRPVLYRLLILKLLSQEQPITDIVEETSTDVGLKVWFFGVAIIMSPTDTTQL